MTSFKDLSNSKSVETFNKIKEELNDEKTRHNKEMESCLSMSRFPQLETDLIIINYNN